MFSYNLQGFTESPDETVQPTDNSRCNISRYTVLNVVESGGSSFGSDQKPDSDKAVTPHNEKRKGQRSSKPLSGNRRRCRHGFYSLVRFCIRPGHCVTMV